MAKILSLSGEALGMVGKTAAKGCYPKRQAKVTYAPVSESRSNTGMSYKHMPVNARPPNWCPDSVRDREERIAMLSDGALSGSWRDYRSGSKCDPKIERAARKQRAACDLIRGHIKK